VEEIVGLAYGGGSFDQVIESGGIARSYTVVIPANASPNVPAPLLVVYHDTRTSVASIQALSGLDALAAELGWVVAYLVAERGSWALSDRFAPGSDGVDDVQFSADVVDRIGLDLNLDPDRTHTLGFGEGGLMAQMFVCRRSSRIASVAAVGTSLSLEVISGCTFDRGVSAMILAGTEDPVHGFKGGRPEGTYGILTPPGGAVWWAEAQGCGQTREITILPNSTDDGTTVERTRFQFCNDHSEVHLYVVSGGGHTWPGSAVDLPPSFGLKSLDIDATTLIGEFFQANPRN